MYCAERSSLKPLSQSHSLWQSHKTIMTRLPVTPQHQIPSCFYPSYPHPSRRPPQPPDTIIRVAKSVHLTRASSLQFKCHSSSAELVRNIFGAGVPTRTRHTRVTRNMRYIICRAGESYRHRPLCVLHPPPPPPRPKCTLRIM